MGSKYEDIMKTKPYLPFRANHLSEKVLEKARTELNETEENREPAIEELRSLIAADTDLNCWTDDAYLLQYLRARKFNVKKAYNLLHNFYQVKKDFAEVYPKELDVETLQNLLFECSAAGLLPYRDEEGCAVLILRIAKWNCDKYPIQAALTGMTALILACIENPLTQICGVHILLDVKGASLKQIRCITPRYIHLFSKALSNCLPVRFKGIHIFNESFIFQYIYSVLKLFLSDKIKKRVHFHGDNAKHLQKHIPKAILSSDYGGDNTSYTEAEWCKTEMPLFFPKYSEMHRIGY